MLTVEEVVALARAGELDGRPARVRMGRMMFVTPDLGARVRELIEPTDDPMKRDARASILRFVAEALSGDQAEPFWWQEARPVRSRGRRAPDSGRDKKGDRVPAAAGGG